MVAIIVWCLHWHWPLRSGLCGGRADGQLAAAELSAISVASANCHEPGLTARLARCNRGAKEKLHLRLSRMARVLAGRAELCACDVQAGLGIGVR